MFLNILERYGRGGAGKQKLAHETVEGFERLDWEEAYPLVDEAEISRFQEPVALEGM